MYFIYNGHFFLLSKFRNIFSSVSPALGVGSPGQLLEHPPPHIKGPGFSKPQSLAVLQPKEGAYLDSNKWGTHLPSLFPLGIQVLVWELI